MRANELNGDFVVTLAAFFRPHLDADSGAPYRPRTRLCPLKRDGVRPSPSRRLELDSLSRLRSELVPLAG